MQAAYELNVPLRLSSLPGPLPEDVKEGMSFLSIDNPAIILDALKKVGLLFYKFILTSVDISCACVFLYWIFKMTVNFVKMLVHKMIFV